MNQNIAGYQYIPADSLGSPVVLLEVAVNTGFSLLLYLNSYNVTYANLGVSFANREALEVVHEC